MRCTIPIICLATSSQAFLSLHPSLLNSDKRGLGVAPPSRDDLPAIKMANHIFNAIHSSMRQWGSSLNHNGMSFFLAQIPAGTELYHGRGDNIPVKGMEWLAFEPEHAMNFARNMSRHPPRDGNGGPPGSGNGSLPGGGRDRRPPPKNPHEESHKEGEHKWPPSKGAQYDSRTGGSPGITFSHLAQVDTKETGNDPIRVDQELSSDRGDSLSQQHPLTENGKSDRKKKLPGGPPPDYHSNPGFLHTYTMNHNLNVIYIDGESAAKSGKGTLDTQDYILCRSREKDSLSGSSRAFDAPRSPFDDFTRATAMCQLASEEWKGGIDGFIRMEHGFELILCDFEKNSDLVRATRVGEGGDLQSDGLQFMSLMSAVGARYHGIGGERVVVNYDNLVTAFAADIDLFDGDDPDLPRLSRTSSDEQLSILADLSEVVRKGADGDVNTLNTVDWQSVTDLIVTRNSDPLYEFAFGESTYSNKSIFDLKLTLLLRPFIDYDDRNITTEIMRCASHFLPKQRATATSTAGAAVREVSTQLCTTLFSAQQWAKTVEEARDMVRGLVTWLRWTSWKECRPGCKYGEICFTAIWPFGDKESHERPYCINATKGGRENLRGKESYWDNPTRH